MKKERSKQKQMKYRLKGQSARRSMKQRAVFPKKHKLIHKAWLDLIRKKRTQIRN